METIALIFRKLKARQNKDSYTLRKSSLKAEFLAMCTRYITSTDMIFVFKVPSKYDIDVFLDIIDDEDVVKRYEIVQESLDTFKVSEMELDIL